MKTFKTKCKRLEKLSINKQRCCGNKIKHKDRDNGG